MCVQVPAVRSYRQILLKLEVSSWTIRLPWLNPTLSGLRIPRAEASVRIENESTTVGSSSFSTILKTRPGEVTEPASATAGR